MPCKGFPPGQWTNDHEPACMCHLYRLRINTHVLTITMPCFIARQSSHLYLSKLTQNQHYNVGHFTDKKTQASYFFPFCFIYTTNRAIFQLYKTTILYFTQSILWIHGLVLYDSDQAESDVLRSGHRKTGRDARRDDDVHVSGTSYGRR